MAATPLTWPHKEWSSGSNNPEHTACLVMLQHTGARIVSPVCLRDLRQTNTTCVSQHTTPQAVVSQHTPTPSQSRLTHQADKPRTDNKLCDAGPSRQYCLRLRGLYCLNDIKVPPKTNAGNSPEGPSHMQPCVLQAKHRARHEGLHMHPCT